MSRHALPYLATARVSGPDAAAFLHAQLSADVAALQVGEAAFACYCSPRGQVYGLLLVCRRQEDFMLVGAAALLPGILQRLRLFVLRARVGLETAQELAVAGDDAEDGNGERWATAVGLAYRLLSREALAASDAAGPGQWKLRELGQGVVWLDPRTTERFIPQMLGFDALGAVSFTKGCYPGQEIVARARYLGKVKRKPLQLTLETGEPPALESGAAVTVVGGGQRFDATLVDWEPHADGVLLFAVAALPEGKPEAVEVGGRSYRCATM